MEPEVIVYIGMTMWFHNPDLYEKSGEKNKTFSLSAWQDSAGNY